MKMWSDFFLIVTAIVCFWFGFECGLKQAAKNTPCEVELLEEP
jgi:hypothetical protein